VQAQEEHAAGAQGGGHAAQALGGILFLEQVLEGADEAVRHVKAALHALGQGEALHPVLPQARLHPRLLQPLLGKGDHVRVAIEPADLPAATGQLQRQAAAAAGGLQQAVALGGRGVLGVGLLQKVRLLEGAVVKDDVVVEGRVVPVALFGGHGGAPWSKRGAAPAK